MSDNKFRLLVLMSEDYTTDSNNLGERTFQARKCYQVCQTTFAELMATGKAVRVHPQDAPRPSAPIRKQVEIVSRITRWFTASGRDTYHLTVGQRHTVPSNLAAFLIHSDFAEAA